MSELREVGIESIPDLICRKDSWGTWSYHIADTYIGTCTFSESRLLDALLERDKRLTEAEFALRFYAEERWWEIEVDHGDIAREYFAKREGAE